jgi:hypothetical protein
VTDKLDEMWTALAEHKPFPSYAAAWQRMLVEKTPAAAWAARAASAAAWAVPEAAVAAEAAVWAASDKVWAAAGPGGYRWADHYAQRAIDAIREVKP